MKTVIIQRFAIALLCLFVTIGASAQTIALTGSPQIIEKTYANYDNNMDMIWNINIGVNKPVKINYVVGMEPNDKVFVADLDASGNLTGRVVTLTGSMSGTHYTQSATGRVRIHYKTDGSICGRTSNYYGFYLQIETDLGLSTSGDLRVSGNSIVNGSLQVGGSESFSGPLYVNNSVRLSSAKGSTVPISRFRNDVNNSLMVNDYLYREADGSSWDNVSYMRGIGVDFSFTFPQNPPRSWVKQYPGQGLISLGNSGKTLFYVKDIMGMGAPGIRGEVSIGESDDVKSGYGYKLSFLGASENSDQLFLARYNHTDNATSLRMNIGDDSAGEDRFEVGTSVYNSMTWTPRFTVLNNGRVGIGTSNPQYPLDVKGTIRAAEVTIESVDNFADFVFEKSYPLPSLEAVRSHIDEKGHLPNIPSAAEVKENGMNLVEMQVRLLQKIEELTLYILEQDRKMKEQEERIKVLESKKE